MSGIVYYILDIHLRKWKQTKLEMSGAHVCFCLTMSFAFLLSFMFSPVSCHITMSLFSVSSSHVLSVSLLIFCSVSTLTSRFNWFPPFYRLASLLHDSSDMILLISVLACKEFFIFWLSLMGNCFVSSAKVDSRETPYRGMQ